MQIKLGSFWMVISAFAFSCMGFFVKEAGREFDFQEIIFWRMLICSIVLIFIAMLKKQTIYTPHWKKHILRGVYGTIAIFLYFYSLVHLPISTAVTLSYTSPIWFLVFSIILFKDRVHLAVFFSMLLSFVGVVLLLQPTFVQGEILLVMIAVACGMFSGLAYIQLNQIAKLNEPEWKIVLYFSLIALLASFIWCLLDRGFHPIHQSNILIILGLGFSSLIGQICLTYAYSEGDKYLTSTLSYITIVFSFFFDVLIYQNILSPLEITGIILIISGGLLVNQLKRPTIVDKSK